MLLQILHFTNLTDFPFFNDMQSFLQLVQSEAPAEPAAQAAVPVVAFRYHTGFMLGRYLESR